VLAVLAIVAAFVLLIGFAIHKMKPDKLRIYGESKLAKFGLEIGRSAEPEQPPVPEPDDRRELEA
jgi:hypothetical protein